MSAEQSPRSSDRDRPASTPEVPGQVEQLLAQCTDEPVAVRRVVVRPSDVVYLKGVVEASAGLATMLADTGGELVLLTSAEQQAELDRLLADLSEEIPLRVRSPGVRPGATSRQRGNDG